MTMTKPVEQHDVPNGESVTGAGSRFPGWLRQTAVVLATIAAPGTAMATGLAAADTDSARDHDSWINVEPVNNGGRKPGGGS